MIHSPTSVMGVYWLFQGLREKTSSFAAVDRQQEKGHWLVQPQKNGAGMRRRGKEKKVS